MSSVVKSTSIEHYISTHALPNEPIVGWLKWELQLDFDKIVLRTEADLVVSNFLNVLEQSVEKFDIYAGVFTMRREWLEVDGFFSFVSNYTKIPDVDRKVTFTVDFVKEEERVGRVEMSTEIIVPGLKVRTISNPNITITDYEQNVSIYLEVEKTGKALPQNVRGFWEIVRGGDRINVRIDGQSLERQQVMAHDENLDSNLEIRGTGFVLIRLGFLYEDLLGNHYKTSLAEFVVEKRTELPSTIPVTGMVEGTMPLVLTSP